MGSVTALNVRRLGLITEAICMFGLLSAYRKNAPEPPMAFGVPLWRIFQVGLGIGLLLWIVGTVAYRRARQKEDE